VNDVRISRRTPRLEQRPRRRSYDMGRLEQARRQAEHEAMRFRLL
jgi:hypothetical protein